MNEYTSLVLHRPIPTQFTFPEKRPGLAFSPKKWAYCGVFPLEKIYIQAHFSHTGKPSAMQNLRLLFPLELSVTDKSRSNKGGCRKSEIYQNCKKKNEPNHSFYSFRTILNCEKRKITYFISQFLEEGLNIGPVLSDEAHTIRIQKQETPWLL